MSLQQTYPAPVRVERRTWRTYNYLALWVGMDWKQAVLTIAPANVIVLVPMLLTGHAGTRYGIPFPVFARASFGVRGASLPALVRAAVG
jgi:NCS1 family nucleobase:cation symporter-1